MQEVSISDWMQQRYTCGKTSPRPDHPDDTINGLYKAIEDLTAFGLNYPCVGMRDVLLPKQVYRLHGGTYSSALVGLSYKADPTVVTDTRKPP